MKTFDKQAARLIGEHIEKELRALGVRLGVEFSMNGGTFGETEMVLKVKVLPMDKTAVAEKAKADFEKYANLYGFEKSDYLQPFLHKGEKFRIVGFAHSRSKFNLKAERITDGKSVLFVADQIAKKMHPTPVQPQGSLVRFGAPGQKTYIANCKEGAEKFTVEFNTTETDNHKLLAIANELASVYNGHCTSVKEQEAFNPDAHDADTDHPTNVKK